MEAVPDLTCVVIAQRDETTLAGSLRAIARQAPGASIQIVVVVSGSAATAALARRTLPGAEVIELSGPVTPGEARNAGLARARAALVSFPGSHVVIGPGSLEARITAHRRGYAMVTGTLRNQTRTWPGWAAYLLDNAGNLPGLPAGELGFPPAHCSYTRAALDAVGGFPPVRSGEDTAVNEALFALGHRAYREPAIELAHRNPCRSLRAFFTHQLIRGAGWGRLIGELHAERRLLTRDGLRHWGLEMLPGRLWFIAANVWRTRDRALMLRLAWASPLVLSGALVTWGRAWLTLLGAGRRAARRAP